MHMNVVTPRFSIGRTLKDSLGIFGRNFVTFALLALAVQLVILVTPSDLNARALAGSGQLAWWEFVVATAGGIIVTNVTQTLVVFGTLQNLRGQRASLSDAWRSVPFIPSILLAGTIMSLPSIASWITRSLLPGNAMALGFWSIVFGAASLFLMLLWWIYVPAIAIERGGLLHGLRRSRYLLSGHRWRVFGLMVIVGIASIAIVFAIGLIGGVSVTDLASVSRMTPVGIAIFVVSALILAFDGVLTTVSYYHLRVAKDGPISEDLVQVFD